MGHTLEAALYEHAWPPVPPLRPGALAIGAATPA
jgi:hypothetical protein